MGVTRSEFAASNKRMTSACDERMNTKFQTFICSASAALKLDKLSQTKLGWLEPGVTAPRAPLVRFSKEEPRPRHVGAMIEGCR